MMCYVAIPQAVVRYPKNPTSPYVDERTTIFYFPLHIEKIFPILHSVTEAP